MDFLCKIVFNEMILIGDFLNGVLVLMKLLLHSLKNVLKLLDDVLLIPIFFSDSFGDDSKFLFRGTFILIGLDIKLIFLIQIGELLFILEF